MPALWLPEEQIADVCCRLETDELLTISGDKPSRTMDSWVDVVSRDVYVPADILNKPGVGAGASSPDNDVVVFEDGEYLVGGDMSGVRAAFIVLDYATAGYDLTTVNSLLGGDDGQGNEASHLFIYGVGTGNNPPNISVDGSHNTNGAASANGSLSPVVGKNVDIGLTDATIQQANLFYAEFGIAQAFNHIGRIYSGEEFRFRGAVYAIVCMTRVPTTLERQQIEGYLAHKYGLAFKLPIGHPYYLYPPVLPFVPSERNTSLIRPILPSGLISRSLFS